MPTEACCPHHHQTVAIPTTVATALAGTIGVAAAALSTDVDEARERRRAIISATAIADVLHGRDTVLRLHHHADGDPDVFAELCAAAADPAGDVPA